MAQPQLNAPTLDAQAQSAIERYVRAQPEFTATVDGKVPAPVTPSGKFLKDDGTWATPASGSGGGYTVQTKIAGYTETATSGELVTLCDLAAGFTVVLPTAVGNTAILHFKKMQAAGSIILDGSGAQTIDGAATATMAGQYTVISLYSDNANWVII